MTHPTPPPAAAGAHEPGARHDRAAVRALWANWAFPIGPDTAREILRAVLALEATRMDAGVREALQTSIDTIRVAAQSANGVLASTVAVRSRPAAHHTQAGARSAACPAGDADRRPAPKRNPDPDTGDEPDGNEPPAATRGRCSGGRGDADHPVAPGRPPGRI